MSILYFPNNVSRFLAFLLTYFRFHAYPSQHRHKTKQLPKPPCEIHAAAQCVLGRWYAISFRQYSIPPAQDTLCGSFPPFITNQKGVLQTNNRFAILLTQPKNPSGNNSPSFLIPSQKVRNLNILFRHITSSRC